MNQFHNTMKNPYIGKWRITEMEQWDQYYIDLVVPGYIEIKKNQKGDFQFGVVEGEIDYRLENTEDRERLEFSWMGQSEYDPVAGRGWALVDGQNGLFGNIYFYMGDESWFKAIKM